jgi:hypothetical protein
MGRVGPEAHLRAAAAELDQSGPWAVPEARRHLAKAEKLLAKLAKGATDGRRSAELSGVRDELGSYLLAASMCEDAQASRAVTARVLRRATNAALARLDHLSEAG